ncbi:transposase [Methylomonas koyamae]|uniref:Transposase n=1 Tax=Methylomonas koyamae TaxID=702114 RepID=A0A177N1Z3_9GAMM|nr:transposase [Methylomonas koyamae]OAI11230.1 transposase [Methylomonas koyamae]
MPRDDLLKGRFSEANRVYHITICTENRQPWFKDFACGRVVVNQMHQIDPQQLLSSLAWVLMPDHLHWLLQLGQQQSLSHVIKLLKGRSAAAVNQHLQRQGSLWQRGFYDHALRRDEDLQQVARYIIANPLRAGLVEKIGDYPLWDAIWL